MDFRFAFGSGDCVQLQSGGPRMTVVEVDNSTGYYQYRCQWFMGGDLKEAMFKGVVLKKALPGGDVALDPGSSL